jgi:chemotaxis protein MotB
MMRTVKLSAILGLCVCVLLLNGCNSEQDLRIQNSTQQKRIDQLEAELAANTLELEQMKKKLAAAQETDSIEAEALQQKVAALEEDLAKKKELIESMQQRLLMGGAALPVELSTMLEDFAKKQPDMVTYDSSRGVVKFKSDLLFDKGSDNVAASAIEAIKSLTTILNTEQGKKFDIIIAGHTDDIPIQKPETRAKHPTNWHLSSHRAIAVLKVMEGDGIDPKRMSVRGFSEYRPVAENKPNHGGNPQNRRVEIYIVAKGT